MARVYVGVGSNLRPEANLQLAVRELRARFGDLELSPVYRNAAVGFVGEEFLNMVIGFSTERSPAELVSNFEDIHGLAGRNRGLQRLVSRTLDIDLLLYDQQVLEQPPVPRADVLDYLFVLQPLVDIAPNLRHPQTGRLLSEHLEEMQSDEVLTPDAVNLESV